MASVLINMLTTLLILYLYTTFGFEVTKDAVVITLGIVFISAGIGWFVMKFWEDHNEN